MAEELLILGYVLYSVPSKRIKEWEQRDAIHHAEKYSSAPVVYLLFGTQVCNSVLIWRRQQGK